jgi:O-antigen/teichoic acid export membrane protein
MVIPPDRFQAAFWIFQFSVISLVVVMFQIPYSAAVIAHEKMDYYAYVGIFDAVLKLLIALAIPYAKGDQLIVYGFLIFLISVVNWCLYFGYSKIHFKELKLHRQFHSDLFKGMLGFSAWNCFGIFSTIMREQGGNMMLNLFFGPVVNAARGIAYQVSGAMESVVLNVSVAARPQLVQSYAVGNTGRTINIMHGISKLCYLCILCVALPVMIEVDYVLKLWLGDVVPEHTNIFLVLVVMASLVRVFHPMTSHIVHATGKMRNFQVVNGVLNLLTVPIAYFLLYQGYEAYSIFVLFIIMNAVIQFVSWRVLHSLVPEFSVTTYLRQVILPLSVITGLSLILPLLAHWGMEFGFWRLMVVILLTVISTFTTGFFIGINQSERELVVSYIRKFLKR